MITVEPNVTRRDVQIGAAIFLLRRRQSKVAFGIVAVVALMALALSAATGDVGLLAAGLAMLLLLPVLAWLAGAQSWKTTPMREGGTLTLDDSGVAFENSTVQSKVSWDVYSAAAETKSMFLLFAPQGFMPVPKRAFAATGDVDTTRAILRDNAHLSSRDG